MKQTITRVLEYGTIISTVIFLSSVLLQIVARFFLPSTPPWTEEASRLFFIYATAFAAGLALKDDAYVHLDVVYRRLPQQLKRVLSIAIPALILLLFGLLAVWAVPFIGLGHLERSPSMGMPMSLAFGSMFLLGAGLSYYAVLDLLKAIKNNKK